MLDIHALRTFLEAARTQNFTEASRTLNLTQPAVSQQIKGLEDYLQVKLFERDGRNMKLSTSGHNFVPLAQQVIQMAINAEETIRSDNAMMAGTLVIGCSAPTAKYILPHLVARFQRNFPEVHVRIPIIKSSEVANGLARGDFDLGVTHSRFPDLDFNYSTFYDDQLVLVAPAAHAWAYKKTITAAELITERFICKEADTPCREAVTEGLIRLGFDINQLNMVMEIGSAEALAMSVEHGIGVSFVSRMVVAPRLSLGRLAVIAVEDMTLLIPTYFAISNAHAASPVAAKFMEFVCQSQTQSLIQMLVDGRML